jgi:chromate transporter
MAMHIGYRRAGFAGLIIAGISFIAPAALMVGLLAAIYVAYGSVPGFATALYMIKPIIIVIIIKAMFDLGRAVLQSGGLVAMAGLAVFAGLAGVNELVVIFVVGLLALARSQIFKNTSVAGFGTLDLFLYFLKVGSALYGSGYVLLALLQTELVDNLGWITEKQLLDSVAVGQFTPGPLFTTATFIGYLLFGFSGAAVATFGIFLPGFIFVAATQPLVRRIHNLAWAKPFVGGINAASIGLILVVVLRLGGAAIVDLPTAGIAIMVAIILMPSR